MDWPRLCTTKLLDQNFGMSISPQDILVPFFNNNSTNYYRPWKLCEEQAKKDFGSTVDNSKDKFQVTLDVQHFLPNEISVKVNEQEIIIEGTHEERQDVHGFISRKFIRRYALPKECPSETVTSTLSSDGVLTIMAKKKIAKEIEGAKAIPIKIEGACRRTEHMETAKIANKNIKTDKCEKKTDKCELNSVKSETKNDKKNVICEIKKDVEKDKAQTQIMLREEHSRLLKPELLKGAAAESELISETKKDTEKLLSESRKETDELLKLISADMTVLSGATGKVEEALGQCKTAIKDLKKEKTGEANMSAMTEMSSMKTGEACMSATTEMSSMKSSMMSETIEMSMSSSSSSSSKATTSVCEKMSDIVSDIITELQEAAENI